MNDSHLDNADILSKNEPSNIQERAGGLLTQIEDILGEGSQTIEEVVMGLVAELFASKEAEIIRLKHEIGTLRTALGGIEQKLESLASTLASLPLSYQTADSAKITRVNPNNTKYGIVRTDE